MPQIDGWEIAASWQPASGVGGDCFDAIAFGAPRLGLSIADVVGKGIPAALLMSNLQAAVRAFATDAAQPAELCQQVNRILCGNIAEGRFISFFYCVARRRAGHADLLQRRPLPADPGPRRRFGRAARIRRRRCSACFPRRVYEQGRGLRSAAAIGWCSSPTASPKRATRPTKSSARSGWSTLAAEHRACSAPALQARLADAVAGVHRRDVSRTTRR